MSEFTSRERAEIHSALDRLIAKHQPYGPRPTASTVSTSQADYAWPYPEDYERIDAQP